MKENIRTNTVSLAYLRENALNAICPYFTMFPLEYPIRVLRKHRKDNPIVLDPFCGRGTTLFAARNLGLSAWGIDTSPVAVAIAKAKLASCEMEDPLELAARLISSSTSQEIPSTPFFREAFHPQTLREICALRESLHRLDVESDASVVLRAAVLGCLHGPLSKNVENAGYFSNQMPRTYAPKPDYAIRYWKKNGLIAPKIDVVHVLKRKINRLIGLSKNSSNSISQVLNGDSQSADTFNRIATRPSVVITSPPYYGMRTYVQDQWLRNWFLGGPDRVDYTTGSQLEHGGTDVFANSLGRVWGNIGRHSSDNLHMYVRFGIIPSASVNAKNLFKASLEASGIDWRLVSVRAADTADAGKRQADQMKTASAAAIEFDFHVVKI
ncbi:DNA methylase [Methylobacter tundripaludum]|uniref:site-specific DNA-methyltransferase (cytosine-N(4)-specific) n=1 Tax=Methylobacter tundripaludum TaxID=173365 RepID=A0A2S6H4X1_9GAMM|nr:DNA methyltransferase [Methylobacter tundripaludum]PPK72539.1 DNA methylase [Methylobacter tundripaludum]